MVVTILKVKKVRLVVGNIKVMKRGHLRHQVDHLRAYLLVVVVVVAHRSMKRRPTMRLKEL